MCVCDISSLRVNGPSEPGRLRDVCVCQWVNTLLFWRVQDTLLASAVRPLCSHTASCKKCFQCATPCPLFAVAIVRASYRKLPAHFLCFYGRNAEFRTVSPRSLAYYDKSHLFSLYSRDDIDNHNIMYVGALSVILSATPTPSPELKILSKAYVPPFLFQPSSAPGSLTLSFRHK